MLLLNRRLKTNLFLVDDKLPGKPKQFKLSVDKENEIILSWAPPENCGETAVTKYYIEELYIPDDDEPYCDWERSSETSSLEYRFSRQLTQGLRYRFRVFAVNSSGFSKEAAFLSYTHRVQDTTGKSIMLQNCYVRARGSNFSRHRPHYWCRKANFGVFTQP